MAGILGTGQTGGILGLLAQQQQQGQAPAYGTDPWAARMGGPGALMWRELLRAMSTQGIGAMAPGNAGDTFSPFVRQFLAPQYQKQGK